MPTSALKPFRRRLSVNLADMSSEGLREIMTRIDGEVYAYKLAAEVAATEETKQRMTEARARLIESSKRIERFLDR